jgi:hypothetical protein
VPQIGLLDVELEDVVVIMDEVMCGPAHDVARRGGFERTAPQDELVVPLAWKAVQDAARIATQVAPLRGRFGDGDEDAAVGQHWDDRMDSRASIRPDRGQMHEDVLLP